MISTGISRRDFFGIGMASAGALALLGALASTAAAAGEEMDSAGTSTMGGEQSAPTEVTVYVFTDEQGIKGPDGKPHDTVVPSSFVVKAGVPIQLTAVNFDMMPHTITAADLGLDLKVKEAMDEGQPTKATATFTAPKTGVYRWKCTLACDDEASGWAMTKGFGGDGQEGFMAGNIVAI